MEILRKTFGVIVFTAWFFAISWAGAQGPVDTRIPTDGQTAAPGAQAPTGGFRFGSIFGWSSGGSSSGGGRIDQGGDGGEGSQDPQGTIDPITGNPISGPRTIGGVDPARVLDGEIGGAGASLMGLTGRIGLAYGSEPNYFGANEGRNRLGLFVDATFGENGFMNNEDGLGFEVLSLGQLESKLSLNARYGQIFEGKTQGLTALEPYGALETDLVFRGLNTAYELELSLPLTGPDGWTLESAALVEGGLGDLGNWSTRLSATYASGDWMKSYYGISSAEAAASGLNAYSPNGGFRDATIQISADILLA